jgi:hypothetical protein
MGASPTRRESRVPVAIGGNEPLASGADSVRTVPVRSNANTVKYGASLHHSCQGDCSEPDHKISALLSRSAHDRPQETAGSRAPSTCRTVSTNEVVSFCILDRIPKYSPSTIKTTQSVLATARMRVVAGTIEARGASDLRGRERALSQFTTPERPGLISCWICGGNWRRIVFGLR